MITANTMGGRAAVALACTLLVVAMAGCNQVSTGAGQSQTSQTDTVSTVSGQSPAISGTPAAHAMVGMAYSFQPSTSDSSGETLTFSVVALPSWATFDAATGRISGTPAASDIGTYAGIVITVSDGSQTASLPAFAISVATETSPTPPTISGTPGTSATVGSTYTFRPSATDAKGANLTFSIAGKPSWAIFNTSTGQLIGTPTGADVGTDAGIVISVADGSATDSLPAFSIRVKVAASPPPPPVISGTAGTTAVVGKAYLFQPGATDAAGGTLTFSITNKPSWATFSTADGRLGGTPAAGNVGTYAGIVIRLSDGQESSALAPFAITVVEAPPTISGTPPTTVAAHDAYAFKPSASGPSGATLSFSVKNLPSWATFSIATGQLSGTPTAAGSYPGIVISVSDGQTSASLPPFAITVSSPGGSATVSWAAPTLNTNGTQLTDLSGFTISYGTSATALTRTVAVGTPSATSYTFSDLAAGTWYFSVKANASDGSESAPSTVVSGTVD